jgi:hypothetical protein
LKKYKTRLKYDFAEALVAIINDAIGQVYAGADDDKLFIAAIAEVKIRLYKKMETVAGSYTISFSPVQAIALHMLYTEFIGDLRNQYTANRMRQIANEIHRHYSLR